MADDKKPQEPAGEPAPEFDENAPVFTGSLSAKDELVAPDGHVNLSKEDIADRAKAPRRA